MQIVESSVDITSPDQIITKRVGASFDPTATSWSVSLQGTTHGQAFVPVFGLRAVCTDEGRAERRAKQNRPPTPFPTAYPTFELPPGYRWADAAHIGMVLIAASGSAEGGDVAQVAGRKGREDTAVKGRWIDGKWVPNEHFHKSGRQSAKAKPGLQFGALGALDVGRQTKGKVENKTQADERMAFGGSTVDNDKKRVVKQQPHADAEERKRHAEEKKQREQQLLAQECSTGHLVFSGLADNDQGT
jgi:hypothetical protein